MENFRDLLPASACSWLFAFIMTPWRKDLYYYKSHCAWDGKRIGQLHHQWHIYVLTWFGRSFGKKTPNQQTNKSQTNKKNLKMLTTLFIYFGPTAPATQLDSTSCTGATAVLQLQVHALPFLLISKVPGRSQIFRISDLIIFTVYCFR